MHLLKWALEILLLENHSKFGRNLSEIKIYEKLLSMYFIDILLFLVMMFMIIYELTCCHDYLWIDLILIFALLVKVSLYY